MEDNRANNSSNGYHMASVISSRLKRRSVDNTDSSAKKVCEQHEDSAVVVGCLAVATKISVPPDWLRCDDDDPTDSRGADVVPKTNSNTSSSAIITADKLSDENTDNNRFSSSVVSDGGGNHSPVPESSFSGSGLSQKSDNSCITSSEGNQLESWDNDRSESEHSPPAEAEDYNDFNLPGLSSQWSGGAHSERPLNASYLESNYYQFMYSQCIVQNAINTSLDTWLPWLWHRRQTRRFHYDRNRQRMASAENDENTEHEL